MSLLLSGHGTHRAEPPRKVRSERDDLACALVRETTRSQLLQDQLDAAGIELSGVRLDLEEALKANARLVVENTRLQAALSNATSVDVAAGHRDVDPDDQPTQPIDVRTLLTRFDSGPIRRLQVSPLAVDPTHVPNAAA